MDEIGYKLKSANPVLISHAMSKLFDSIKKMRTDAQADHISKTAEFKLLLTKKDSADLMLSTSACQALVALVEDGLWDINEALSTFASSVSTMKNSTAIATAISHLLILDLKHTAKNQSMYPFTLHAPQHPFLLILACDAHSWQTILSQMIFIMNHTDPRIKENAVRMLRPVFLHVLCDPSSDTMSYYMQDAWRLLIESKHAADLRSEILLWSCTTERHCCINTNYRILELAQTAVSNKNKEHCTALLPMVASLIIQLLKQGSDPRANFDTIMAAIDHCDPCIGNLMLTLMAEVLVLSSPIYLYSALQICAMVVRKLFCSDIFLSTVKASVLNWMAYSSVLCTDALDMGQDLTNDRFTKKKFSDKEDSTLLNSLFTVFSISDQRIQLYAELVNCLTAAWKGNDILPWLKNMSRASMVLKDRCKQLISGILFQTHEPEILKLCCGILVDVIKETKSYASHVLSLVLHKLTKSRSSQESKSLLLTLPELAVTKENVPIVTHTLDTLLTGDRQLKCFSIELYLKALKKEPRCYRFISAAIIRLMKSDISWYSNATCARAMKHICEYYPEHGEKLVPLLSQILNLSTDSNGGTASALALGSISALCRASVIDICSTWRVLAPKMKKEKRPVVLESLCELCADIASYPPPQCTVEYDLLIDDVVSKLWKYVMSSDVKLVDSAFRALASYRLEQISLKTLPEEFKQNLVLPNAKTFTADGETQMPEDVFAYIPGSCWIQMLQNMNRTTLSAAGNLLISFIAEEVAGFRGGIYSWPQGEPQNFKYLPQKSVIRAVGEYLRKSSKTDSANNRIVTECLRIFAHRYTKPLPNVNWSFLNDIANISVENKEYTLSIACRHARISLSAKSLIDNYLTLYKSIDYKDIIWKNSEHSMLYMHLGDLCQAVQLNNIKPFLEATLNYVVEKVNLDNENSFELFHTVMTSCAQALTYRDADCTVLHGTLEKLSDKFDLTCARFQPLLAVILQFSMNRIERMTSPKVWWEITDDKLKNAIAIGVELALKKVARMSPGSNPESPLTWFDEIIDETANSTFSVQAYFLEAMQRVQTELQFEKFTSTWILDLMRKTQVLFMDSTQDHNLKIQFYCDTIFISVISLSGIDCMLMKQDLLVKTQDIRARLFPQAIAILSDREDWKHAIPQVMEWLNYMRTSTVPSKYKFTFHRSLICLRHNPHYKSVWTKYLSIKTVIDF